MYMAPQADFFGGFRQSAGGGVELAYIFLIYSARRRRKISGLYILISGLLANKMQYIFNIYSTLPHPPPHHPYGV